MFTLDTGQLAWKPASDLSLEHQGKHFLPQFSLVEPLAELPGWVILPGVHPHRVRLGLEWQDAIAKGHMHHIFQCQASVNQLSHLLA